MLELFGAPANMSQMVSPTLQDMLRWIVIESALACGLHHQFMYTYAGRPHVAEADGICGCVHCICEKTLLGEQLIIDVAIDAKESRHVPNYVGW